MARKLTIHDIALSWCIKSTVSRVLNDSINGDPITRERVQHVIAELDFVPDQTAMQLANGDCRLIGILLPAFWSFMTEIIQGVADTIQDSSYGIILYSSSSHKDFRSVIGRFLATNLTAGLLASIHTHSLRHLVTLSRRDLPVALVNTTSVCLDIPWVSVDNAGGMRLATHHLLSLGHKRIAFEMVFSLLDPRFVSSRNWWAFALPPDTEERARTSAYNRPSCCIRLLLPLVVRNSCGAGHQSPYQNTS